MEGSALHPDLINAFSKHVFLKQAGEDLWPLLEPYSECRVYQSGEVAATFEPDSRFYVFTLRGKINLFKGEQKIAVLGAHQMYCWSFILPGNTQPVRLETSLPAELVVITFPNTLQAFNTEIQLLSRLLHWFAFLPEPGSQVQETEDDLLGIVQKYKHTQAHLFSIFNHDLRSPVASLISLVDLCQSEAENENWGMVQQLLEDIRELGDIHLRMLENLKQWAELRAGRKKPNLREVSLQHIIDASEGLILPSYQKKEIDLKIHYPPTELKIITDQDFAISMLTEILRNACKFSYRKQQVVVETEKQQDKVAIQVIDQGKGFRTQNLESIFTPGKNKIDYGTENEPGTGLGLLIVKEMADLVGAQIKIESEPGKGSIFTLNFPLAG